MKCLLYILISLILFSISCKTNTESSLFENTDNTLAIKVESSATPEPDQENITSKIGSVKFGNKCVLLFIENANLKVGDKVQIILPEHSSQKISEAEIIKFSKCKDEHFGELVPDDPKAKLTGYLLKLSNNNKNRGFGIGIGVVDTNKKVKIVNNLAIIDLNGDEKNEYFRECTSNEGWHLTVWDGKPLEGKRIWHSYYYIDYDTEPNCTEKDYENTID